MGSGSASSFGFLTAPPRPAGAKKDDTMPPPPPMTMLMDEVMTLILYSSCVLVMYSIKAKYNGSRRGYRYVHQAVML